MKCCKLCGETKHLEDFSPLEKMTDGRNSRCKACAARLYREKYGPARRQKEKEEQQPTPRCDWLSSPIV